MKRILLFVLLVCALLLLPACSDSASSASGEKLQAFSGAGNLPLRAVKDGADYYFHCGTFSSPGGTIAYGTDPSNTETIYTLPETATLRSFTAKGGLLAFSLEQASSDGKHTQTTVMVYDKESGKVREIGTASALCATVVLLDGKVWFADENGTTLLSYDPKAASPMPEQVLTVNRISALSEAQTMLVLGNATDEGQTVIMLTPGKDPVEKPLPAAVSLLHGIDYDPTTGIFALYYTDTQTQTKCIGTWFLTSTTLHAILSESEYFLVGSEIRMVEGKICWVTVSSVPGVEYPHYRVVVWDNATGVPKEYMRGFAYSLNGTELLYLAFDSNRKTDSLALYLASVLDA